VQDAVVSFYDIYLGLPKDAIWLKLPPDEQDQQPGRDLLIVLGPGHKTITFKVRSRGDARAAWLAGDFTDWRQLAMNKVSRDSYAISLSVPEGTHGYKYIIDGLWLSAPSREEAGMYQAAMAKA
jgi:hypothetical protein